MNKLVGTDFVPNPDSLIYLPLGGSGEIGMNLNLYGYRGKWLMVDFGIGFADDTLPGIDVVLPDPSFIEERRKDLVGLVVTHAHEDHIGAIQYLWPRLRCPVYATPFTAAMLRSKLIETSFASEIPIHLVTAGDRLDLDPFGVELVAITHSIPEPTLIVVRTDAGVIVHTGDWKLDDGPVIGQTTDVEVLRNLGREGVLAMVADSTNAMVPGRSGSESDLLKTLTAEIGKCSGRVAIACFASNVARLDTISRAAAANGRNTALVGRSLWRVAEAARQSGYLRDVPHFISEHDAGFLPNDKVVMICTGSQGEPRSALSRIAADDHPEVSLSAGDTVIFSSRTIPGNEKAIGRVQGRLAHRGIRIVTADDAPVHVSGHPAQDEMIQMYQWIRPRVSVPTHGESRHQAAHAKLARQCQVSEIVVPEDGTVIQLAPGPARVVDHVPVGQIAIDGKRFLEIGGGALKGRQKILHNGSCTVSLVLNSSGELLADPQIVTQGLFEVDSVEESKIVQHVIREIRDDVESMQPSRAGGDPDAMVREKARIAARRTFNRVIGKKPVTDVMVVRV